MSAGFYLTSSFIYINMGCEMMFVLTNRMNAQNIDMSTVGAKILGEITNILCKPEFIDRILKPQTPISIPTFYELLSKIVNSSAMKLDKTSLQKLFYLILMTFKKQVFLSSSPLELYSLTKCHMEDLARMQKNNKSIQQLIQRNIQSFHSVTSKYTFTQYVEIREEILSMLESYKSRIVLFVEVGLQVESGELVHVGRNSHVQKELGMGVNHPSIEFNIPQKAIPKKRLHYNNYLQWRTDLGKDDYDNIRGSSKFIKSKNEEKTENESSISDFLGLGNIKLDTFEVKLDLFDDGSASYAPREKASTNNEVTSMIKNVANYGASISSKIEKQFQDLKIEDEEEKEVDLLDMMDD